MSVRDLILNAQSTPWYFKNDLQVKAIFLFDCVNLLKQFLGLLLLPFQFFRFLRNLRVRLGCISFHVKELHKTHSF